MPVKLLLELSMECESLARAEALAVARTLGGQARVLSKDRGVLVLQTSADPAEMVSRLALCHHVSEWLGSCKHSDVDVLSSGIEVSGPVRVRATRIGDPLKSIRLDDVARRVGGMLGKSGGVDLHSPRDDIRIVYSTRTHIGRVLGSVDRASFEARRNQNMPFRCPISLHPKYARALVNLVSVRPGGRLLDPFCGTGAIVAEAAMIGLDAIGTDISDRMIEGAERNLRQLGLSARLRVCDVGDIVSVVGSADGIATDPPYGKSTSTRGESIPRLYARSFEVFKSVLKKGARIGIVVPDIDLLGHATDVSLVEEHALRVHRSLTRHFCVLRTS